MALPTVRRAALLALAGQRMLAVEGQEADPARIRSALAWAQLDEVRILKRIPMDLRHNAKVDYPNSPANSPDHEGVPPPMSRWWVYQNERFPIAAHGPLIGAFSFCAVAYSADLREPGTWPALRSALVAFASSFIFFLAASNRR